MSEPPDMFTLAGIAAEDFCLAQSPDGYACTEEPGHDGWHRAQDHETHELFDTWHQEDT